MKIITGRNVIYQNENQSSACGCSGFDAETSDASGKKGGDFLNKAQGLFQKGKGFLDNNQGIKDTLGGLLGNKKPSNDSAPTQTYNVPPAPEPKKKMSMGVKIGIGVAAAAVIGTIIYFVVKGKGKK